MVDVSNSIVTEFPPARLTPRQDRLQAAIVEVLRTSGTRSELRELVGLFADHMQMQEIPLDRATGVLEKLGARATPFMNRFGSPAVGDSPADRIAMMVRWCAERYRAD